LSAQPQPRITVADIELELAFDFQLELCCTARTRQERSAAFERMQDLHKQRRPHMVELFERERGLRK
jgi:hypothetical protein